MSITAPVVLDRKAIAARILRVLARAGARGRLVRLDELAVEIGVRRADVRGVVAQLHAEGHVDAARLTLTLSGLALAASMRRSKLRAVRTRREQAGQTKVA